MPSSRLNVQNTFDFAGPNVPRFWETRTLHPNPSGEEGGAVGPARPWGVDLRKRKTHLILGDQSYDQIYVNKRLMDQGPGNFEAQK